MTHTHARSGAPGLFIEESSAGDRRIRGLETSDTAFVGRTWMGPANSPTVVESWEAFERHFGGLAGAGFLPLAVQDFFNNGGRRAALIRVIGDDTTASSSALPSTPEPAEASGDAPSGEPAYRAVLRGRAQAPSEAIDGDANLPLLAASPGAWGNHLEFRFRRSAASASTRARVEGLAASGRLPEDAVEAVLSEMFTLEVQLKVPGQAKVEERFTHLSAHPDAGGLRVDCVLRAQSRLVRLKPQSIGEVTLPEAGEAGGGTFAGGTDHEGPLSPTHLGAGLEALTTLDDPSLVCIPPDDADPMVWYAAFFSSGVYATALGICARQGSLLIVDAPGFWVEARQNGELGEAAEAFVAEHGGPDAGNAAVFFPWLRGPDPRDPCGELTRPPCGAVAGVMARTDATRGPWRAAAGTRSDLRGVCALEVDVQDADNLTLQAAGVNVLRRFPGTGPLIWGDHVLRAVSGNDRLSVRRMSLHLSRSLTRGTRWAVFEPNDERLWSALRSSVSAFMQDLQRQGAFAEFSVACGADTTSDDDVASGVVRARVSFATNPAAEHVFIQLQQQASAPHVCP